MTFNAEDQIELGRWDADKDDIMLASVRALRACVLDDEKHGRIDAGYQTVLLELRKDLDRILGPLCGRCERPLGDGQVAWHERCPA